MLSDEIPPVTASVKSAPEIGPVRPQERIEVIDILRGFALFGILLVNSSHDAPWDFLFEEQWPGILDRTTWWLVHFFGSNKFKALFSLLFGLGFAIQIGRAEKRGAPFFTMYGRRLLILWLIGISNQLFLFHDDILQAYAVFGFLLLVVCRWSSRSLLILFLVCLLIPVGQEALAVREQQLQRANPEAVQQEAQDQTSEENEQNAGRQWGARLWREGSYVEVLDYHIRDLAGWYSTYPVSIVLTWLGFPFPLFLLGLYAGRRRIFESIHTHIPLLRNVLRWGLGLGVAGTFLSILVGELFSPTGGYAAHLGEKLLWTVAVPALCLFYVSAVTLLTQHESWKRRLSPLAMVGRTALSNYLFQSVFHMMILYSSFGLGIFQIVSPLVGVGLAFGFFLFQILLSMWWLRHFRFGPAEWLWRTLTYGRLQPMRV